MRTVFLELFDARQDIFALGADTRFGEDSTGRGVEHITLVQRHRAVAQSAGELFNVATIESGDEQQRDHRHYRGKQYHY